MEKEVKNIKKIEEATEYIEEEYIEVVGDTEDVYNEKEEEVK